MARHLVLCPDFAQGHVISMLHLAERLASRGLLITVVNIPSVQEKLKQTWNFPSALRSRIHLESLDCPVDLASDDLPANLRYVATVGLSSAFEKVIAKLPRVRSIIYDFVCVWTHDAAEKFNIPEACYFPSSAACIAVEYHIPSYFTKGQPFPASPNVYVSPKSESEIKAGMAEALKSMPGIQLTSQQLPLHIHNLSYPYLNKMGERLYYLKKSSWILVNSFHELETQVFDEMQKLWGPRFVPIGPMFQDASRTQLSLKKENVECLKWLDSCPPKSVLYISFGSRAVLSLDNVTALARGLILSRQPFLWVMRAGSVAGEFSAFQQTFLEVTRLGRIAAWVAQQLVLGHASIGGFLTHCGWGSVMESIYSGVPMIGWPFEVDQSTNCKIIVEDRNIGVTFSKGKITEEKVQKAIEDLMRGSRGKVARSNVERLRDAAKKAQMKDGLSKKALQDFVEDMAGTGNE